jgi:hypothetical protein
MVFTPKGKHLVAGERLDGTGTFAAVPAHGPVHHFTAGVTAEIGTPDQIFGGRRAETQKFLASAR